MRLLFACIIAALFINPSPVRAGDGPDWLTDPKEPAKGVVSNDYMMLKKDSSASELLMLADSALKSGKVDHAIELVKRSLELDKEDLDAHMTYASALEKKMAAQTEKDPEIFNLCVKEWLAVLRNKYGEEKSETMHGIGLPGVNGKFFADDERQAPARQHLLKLTGFSPKLWETDAKFLSKVLRQSDVKTGAATAPDASGGEKPEAKKSAGDKSAAEKSVGSQNNTTDK